MCVAAWTRENLRYSGSEFFGDFGGEVRREKSVSVLATNNPRIDRGGGKMSRLLICVAALCIISDWSLCSAFVSKRASPRVESRVELRMNTAQTPVSPTSDRQAALKRTVFGFGSVFSVALLRRERAVAIELPECSDSVTIFRREADKREIIMIGTAHISEESANLVRRTIRTVKPDVVMIELDPKRIGKIAGEQRTLEEAGFDLPVGAQVSPSLSSPPIALPKEQKNFVAKTVESFSNTVSMWVQNAGGQLLGKVLSQFYKSVEKLGFVAGGEFKAAVEEGREIGARILLGDRDVDVTLSRLATAVSASSSESFDRVVAKIAKIEDEAGINLPVGDGDISKDTLTSFIESVKSRDLLASVLGTVQEELPEVYAALIGERDAYMAEAVGSSPGVNLVGVVGMAHMGGIERYLTSRKGFSVVKRNCPSLQ